MRKIILFDLKLRDEDVAYLPWLSFPPLAAGMLSGKYIDGARPEGSQHQYAA
ncbi:hypothetical protein O9993_00605 [Vibrio lentus]|nr:hypothetical protein [Vibrio lentus]